MTAAIGSSEGIVRWRHLWVALLAIALKHVIPGNFEIEPGRCAFWNSVPSKSREPKLKRERGPDRG